LTSWSLAIGETLSGSHRIELMSCGSDRRGAARARVCVCGVDGAEKEVGR
jgi:hypothetical protein